MTIWPVTEPRTVRLSREDAEIIVEGHRVDLFGLALEALADRSAERIAIFEHAFLHSTHNIH
jgi:hypothetical protein